VYRETLQAEALALMAARMRSSLMIEGELLENGLAALGDDDQDVMLALAPRLTDQSVCAEHSLEGIFARSRAAKMEDAEYLVGDDVADADRAEQEVDDQTPTLIGVEGTACREAAAQSISFRELAQLLRRPKPRRKPVPAEQRALFREEIE
jgi:hypothetical protein